MRQHDRNTPGTQGVCPVGGRPLAKRHWLPSRKSEDRETNRLPDTEDRLMAASGEGLGGWVKRAKGLRSTDE